MLQNQQKSGDISNSTVVGANVNGNGVSIHHNTIPEGIIEILKNQNEIIKNIQEQIGCLIGIINKLSENRVSLQGES